MKHPLIAVVVSTYQDNGESFLRHYELNPKCFKVISRPERLLGIDHNTPIIVTYSPYTPIKDELMAIVNFRFKNVRYIDY